MAPTLQVHDEPLRKEVIDGAIKALAKNLYKFKQVLSISTTNAWKNTYYREASAALTGNTFNKVKGIPRGANFPQASVKWEKVPSWVEKYGLEENIFWEDILTSDIDVQSRTVFKITEGVVNSVDSEIWDELTEGTDGVPASSPSNIHTFTLGAAYVWDGVASAAIIDDLMRAKEMIGVYNYPTNNLTCFISEKDHRSITNYVIRSGAQFDRLAEDAAKNGRVAGLAGIKFIVSNNVTASFALVVVPKLCGTWQSAVPLKTDITVDPFKSTRIRAVEMGVTQVHTPKAIVLIQNTQG